MTEENNPKKEKKKKQKGVESRKCALEVLLKIESDQAYSNIALSSALGKSQLSKRDKAFVTCLVQGVMRNKNFLDSRIETVSNKPLKKMSNVVLNVLRLGVFQLDFLDDVPPSAILNTSTTLARKCGHEGLAKFTNGVLRNYLRQKEKEKDEGIASSKLSVDELSLKYSTPVWLVERWIENYGTEEAVTMLKHSISQPEVFVRCNQMAITPEGLKTLFEKEGVTVVESTVAANSLKVVSSGKVKGGFESFPGYDEGLFTIQDEAASLVSQIVSPKEGETILDLCAAPGGKTLHLAEIMNNTGRVIACDIYDNRLNLLRQSLKRLDLTNIEIICENGAELSLETPADKVLIDAPCTGTGVLNRRPDLKYRREPDDISSLVNIQKSLLTNAANLVKPDGIIVYSTCSFEPEENFQIVDEFVQANDNYKFDDLRPFLSDSLMAYPALSATAKIGKLQLLPSMNNLSGFFIARIKRVG